MLAEPVPRGGLGVCMVFPKAALGVGCDNVHSTPWRDLR